MVSTTSGTTTFSMDVDEIIEQALEPLGKEHQSAIDSDKARRKLNLVLIMMQNKQIPLAKLNYVTQALTATTAAYTLNTNIVAVLECSLNDGTTDIALERYSVKEYQNLPIKTTEARPTTFLTERNRDAIDITFWPVPDDALTYTAKMLVSQKIEDVTASYQKVDVSTRFLPLLVNWLSYELSKTRENIPENTRNRLKADYKELLPDTLEEDRERVDWKLVPGGVYSGG